MGTELSQHELDLQKIAGFRLLDDDFMTKVFDGATEELSYVLTVILGFKVIVVDVKTQYEIKNLKGRSARLDIYAKNEQGIYFNVEIQRADKGAGVKRARFNSSMIDSNMLKAGTKDYPLPEVYVIFITENDVLGAGLGIYHIERWIEELNKPFDDGEHIVYVNGQYAGDSDLGRLMHDFRCTKADEIYNPGLAKQVRYYKETEEGVAAMCKVMEDMRNEAANAASLAKAVEIAKSLITDSDMTDEQISKHTGVMVTEVAKLWDSILQPV